MSDYEDCIESSSGSGILDDGLRHRSSKPLLVHPSLTHRRIPSLTPSSDKQTDEEDELSLGSTELPALLVPGVDDDDDTSGIVEEDDGVGCPLPSTPEDELLLDCEVSYSFLNINKQTSNILFKVREIRAFHDRSLSLLMLGEAIILHKSGAVRQ